VFFLTFAAVFELQKQRLLPMDLLFNLTVRLCYWLSPALPASLLGVIFRLHGWKQWLYLPCARMVHMQSQSIIYHAQIAYATMAYF